MTAPGELGYMNPPKLSSKSPSPNRDLQCSTKDGSPKNLGLPRPFQARPKVSRTPPNAPEGFCSRNDRIRHHMRIMVNNCHNKGGGGGGGGDSNSNGSVGQHNSNDLDHPQCTSSKQSISFNSPSLSIEYPPGATIPRRRARTKFQFKKSHYQRFVGTSSAQKTTSYQSKWKSRSNSIVSDFHDSHNGIYDTMDTTLGFSPTTCTALTKGGGGTGGGGDQYGHSNHTNNNNNNIHSNDTSNDCHDPNNIIICHNQIHYGQCNMNTTGNSSNASLPPSPPSDQVIELSNRKQAIVSRVSLTNDSNKSEFSECSRSGTVTTVSSSPSIIDEQYTTTQHMNLKSGRTKGRAPWNIHEHVQIRQAIEASTANAESSRKRALSAARVNFATIPKRKGPITFGTKMRTDHQSETDRIRMSLSEYDKQRGQNLEELFRVKKGCSQGCFRCIVL